MKPMRPSVLRRTLEMRLFCVKPTQRLELEKPSQPVDPIRTARKFTIQGWALNVARLASGERSTIWPLLFRAHGDIFTMATAYVSNGSAPSSQRRPIAAEQHDHRV